MALTIVQKQSIRRHLGYPVAGLYRTSVTGGTLASGAVGYRYFQAYGFLEYKMNNLNVSEESSLTGQAYGGIGFVGIAPLQLGDTISAVLAGTYTGSPQTVSYSAAANETLLSVCQNFAGQVAANTVLASAGIYAVAPYGTGPYAANVIPVPEVGIASPASFTMTLSASPGGAMARFGAIVTAPGTLLPPFSVVDPSTTPPTTIYGYLPLLDYLEGAWISTTQNLDVTKADVYTARQSELKERKMLYCQWQRQLSEFLGTPINPFSTNKNNRARMYQ